LILALGAAAHAADTPAPGSAASPAPAAPADSAPAARPGQGTEAQIPFADRGGIYNWQPVDDRTLLIESLDHHWYKATLMVSCLRLPFAERIGFEWNPDGSFDKFSAIQVGAQRCPVATFVKTSPPAKKTKDKKPGSGETPPSAPPKPAS
jgi:hypothetical protein